MMTIGTPILLTWIRTGLAHRCRSTTVPRISVHDGSGADATQTGRSVVAKGIGGIVSIEMLVVRFASSTAATGGLASKRIGRLISGVRGVVEAQFLFFIVCLVAHARTPRFVGIEAAACAAAAANAAGAVARVFVAATGSVAVVAVLELADLGVDPALDAGGSGARVV